MKTPTQEQFQVVIDNLEKADKIAKKRNNVDMSEPHLNSCGSPMCHGGWYAVVKGLPEWKDFHDGAQLMANDLGFDEEMELTSWAHLNPTIWGNKNGGDMFYNTNAFLDGKTKITKLSQIIKHWKAVKERAALPPKTT